MTQVQPRGVPSGGKPINLNQLDVELAQAGVATSGLGMTGGYIHPYAADGHAADFPPAQQATVDQVVSSHTALRDKTDAEYATEFQDPQTTAARKQEIRDITAGLLPREQVPMT